MKHLKIILISGLFIFFVTVPVLGQNTDLLSPEQVLWLKSRNNTIVVYPEKNFPPYSYQNSRGVPQGLSIDYIELVAQKIGAKIEYLPPRPLAQILDDVKHNDKSDLITSVTPTKEREDFLYFTDNYLTIPAVIVVRKDSNIEDNVNLEDLSGKRVVIGSKYAVESFVRENNPKIIIDPVIDDESGLQQLVLGEADAAIMDRASLYYFLSKQILNSVRVVGNTGFEYKFSFAVPKDKEILQSIINKGLSQISDNDRDVFLNKWIASHSQTLKDQSFLAQIKDNISIFIVYSLVGLFIIIIILYFLLKRNYGHRRYLKKFHNIDELKMESFELEEESIELKQELEKIKQQEDKLKREIEFLKK